MGISLQDQLLKSGLVSDQQAKKAKTDKRKQEKKQRHNKVVADNANLKAAQQAKQEKNAHDRELNQKRQQQQERKAALAQIKQLISNNSQPQDEQGDAYHFSDAGKVKSVYISEVQRKQLSRGQLAIARLDRKYYLLAVDIAEKIRKIDASRIISIEEKQQQAAADDPYADYQVPDDLMW